jgi:hypothetical protein
MDADQAGQDPRKKALEQRRDELRENLASLVQRRRTSNIVAIVIVVAAGLAAFFLPYVVSLSESSHLRALIAASGVTYAILAFAIALRQPVWQMRGELADVENEIDLLSISSQSHEQKAQKLLRIQQQELNRYYDQTLRQSGGIFYVGVVAMVLGFLVIAGTLYFVGYDLLNTSGHANRDEFGEKIVVATFGAIGGILTNFVGALYMKMFSEIVTAVSRSHQSLVSTYHFQFANLLASQITNDEIRQKTLSDLALSLEKPAS